MISFISEAKPDKQIKNLDEEFERLRERASKPHPR
jgi:hypothetical protein